MMHRSALMLMLSGVIGLSGSVWARQPDLLTPPDHTKPKVFGWNEVPEAFTPHARLGRMMHIDVVGLVLVQRRWVAKCSSR